MLPNKIENTPELSSMITSLRKENTQKNGKVMSKEQVSLAMGKGRTWLSQIETGRLKKVSSEDLTKVFEIVLNIDHDEAKEKVLEYYESYAELNTQFTQLLKQFCCAANDKYYSLKTQADQKRFLHAFQDIYFNFSQNIYDFAYLVDRLDLSLLNTADKLAKDTIHKKMNELKRELSFLNKNNILKVLSFTRPHSSFHYTKNEKNTENKDSSLEDLKSCQSGLNLLCRLSDGCKRKLYALEEKDLIIINSFLGSIELYSNFHYPDLNPFSLPPITIASVEELDDRISIMKKQLELIMQTF